MRTPAAREMVAAAVEHVDADQETALTPSPTRVLVVDDEKSIARAVGLMLRNGGFAVAQIDDLEQISGLANSQTPHDHDVILLDVDLATLSGLDVLRQLRIAGCLAPIIMLTGDHTSATATAALRGGAFHYLTKPVDPGTLIDVVDLAARHARVLRELARPAPAAVAAAGTVVGSSPAMVRLRGQIGQLGRADVSVVITGESGTGKEVVARALHEASKRRGKRFVALNCGAVAPELIDSELFGHARGAFTGAVATRAGVFAEADGGTLFLDEIGDMPLPVQTRLLRALQEREIRPVGSDGTQTVDVRVLAATHVDLAQAVERGRFRADLFFRLNVVNLQLPPLRERLDDLAELIAALLRRHADAPIPALTADALDALTRYPWPGNVRELENALRHALTMRTGPTIDVMALPALVAATYRAPRLGQGSGLIATHTDVPLTEAKRRAAAEFERDYLLRGLEQARGSVSAAARAAGIDRTNFRRLLHRHGIDPASFKS